MAIAGVFQQNVSKMGSSPIQGQLSFPVKAETRCRKVGIAVLDAGYVCPGHEATGLVAVGWFDEDVDNSSGAAGAVEARVVPGTRCVNNSEGADELTQADVGKAVFIVDDNTVARTSDGGARSSGPKLIRIEPDGRCWVQIVLV